MGPEDEEDLYYYQCKQCPERFKTTVDLQKHKRLNHRSSNGLSSSQSQSLAPMPSPVVLLSPTAPAPDVNGEIEPGRPTTPCTGVTGEISARTPSGRHVTCSFCCYKYDTEDPVVLHLLKLYRREIDDDGCLKCPFCLKVQLQIELGEDASTGTKGDAEDNSPSPVNKPTRIKRRKSPPSPSPPGRRMKLRKRSSTKAASGSSTLSSSAPVTRERRPRRAQIQNEEGGTPPLRVGTRHSIKRDGGSQQGIEKSKGREPLYKLRKGRLSRTPSAPANSPAVLSSSSGFNAPAMLVPSIAAVASQMTQIIRSKGEAGTHEPIPNGTQERLDRRRRRSHHRDDNYSKSESPRIPPIPILINDKPVSSSGRRVAVVARGKNDKRNLTCEQCGYVGETFRQIQSHLNTHMPISFPCDFCSKVYQSNPSKMKHTERHHAAQLHEQRRTVRTRTSTDEDVALNEDVHSLSNHSNSSNASKVCSSDGGSSINNVNHVDGTRHNMDLNLSTRSHASITVVETPRDHLSTSQRGSREFFMLQLSEGGTVLERKVQLENF